MKKFINLFPALATAVALTACAASSAPHPSFTTEEYHQYVADMAKVNADRARVDLMPATVLTPKMYFSQIRED